ncbi:hypothetical protein OPV22_020198 [Ensete ventricosum]|uniref:Uncharacterized protein n=1 Tax=Ensete ventricosum TaxID=4639 RepID=A0AAV8QDP3_ENSVE|nr:hypothetical protein OPV22_020198 [Ensete ventricosum]
MGTGILSTTENRSFLSKNYARQLEQIKNKYCGKVVDFQYHVGCMQRCIRTLNCSIIRNITILQVSEEGAAAQRGKKEARIWQQCDGRRIKWCNYVPLHAFRLKTKRKRRGNRGGGGGRESERGDRTGSGFPVAAQEVEKNGVFALGAALGVLLGEHHVHEASGAGGEHHRRRLGAGLARQPLLGLRREARGG